MLINKALLQKAQTIGKLLLAQQAKVTTAESCTGGAVAASITAIEGSSAWFDGGFVTYSNKMKTQLLGVPSVVIAEQGVVSEAVVKLMVIGACENTQAEYGIALSGVAGPSGGTEAQPVGTICVAWGAPKAVFAQTFYFEGSRDSVREQATAAALLGLTQYLQDAVFQ